MYFIVLSLRLLASGNCAHDKKRFVAFNDRVGQGSVGRFVRNIFAANKETNQRSALECSVFANRSAQNWIFIFERVEQRFYRRGSVKIDMYLVADFCQRSQVMRKNNANHFRVCASTESTAGRSRTIGVQESPASLDP